MKHKLTENLFLKIISLIVAALFWILIVNMIDPATKRTFENIPVEIINDNVILSANQVYEVTSGDTVDVTVQGKRSFVEGLSADDLKATADLSELSKVNAVSIHVTLEKVTNTNVELDWGDAVLKVSLEKRITQKFKVNVTEQGELSDGYVLGDVTAKPNILEVSGGESKLKKVDHVGVMIPLNGQSDNFTDSYKPVLYNEDNEVVDLTNITFSSDTVKVFVEVRPVTTVSIKVVTMGEPADGYHLISTDCQPQSVSVSASDRDMLKKLGDIVIKVNIDGAKKDMQTDKNLSDYFGSDYRLEEDTSTVSVHCDIERSGHRTFYITAADVEVNNLPDKHTLTVENEDEKYKVVVTGRDALLKKLDISDLGASIDLSGYSEGSYDIPVVFDAPDGVSVKSEVSLRAIITKTTVDTQ